MSEVMSYIVELTVEGVSEYERQALNLVIQNEVHRLLHARLAALDGVGNLVVKPIIEVNTLCVSTLQ